MKICNATLHEKKIELKSNEIKITSANEVMLMQHATHHYYNIKLCSENRNGIKKQQEKTEYGHKKEFTKIKSVASSH